jgi:NADH-quinone oxidoreductase subunit G
MAEHLRAADRALVLIGDQAMGMEDYSVLQALSQLIAELSGANLGYLTEGANTVGAWLAGVVPHRGVAGEAITSPGADSRQLLQSKGMGFITLGIEPELDAYDAASAMNAMQNADCVISLTAFDSDNLRSYADVLLPIATFAETSGTFINGEGQWQSFNGALSAQGEARPAWKILRVLGNMFDLQGFDYMSSEEVRDELFEQVEGVSMSQHQPMTIPSSMPEYSAHEICRIGETPPYAVDALVRRAKALQNTHDGDVSAVYINDKLAASLSFGEGDMIIAEQNGHHARLPLKIDNRLPDSCAWVASGMSFSTQLCGRYAAITLKKS